MSRRPRHAVLLAVGTLLVSSAVVHCKQEEVRTVRLTLGVDNAGSQGFACRATKSAACTAFADCAIEQRARTEECLLEACRERSNTADCVAMVNCVRSNQGTPTECYKRTCLVEPPLLTRAQEGGTISVHLIVEYVGLGGGLPGCRVTELTAYCGANPGRCRPVRRTCVQVSFPAPADAGPNELSRLVAVELAKKRVLDDDAPSDPVLVRIIGVAKAGACDPSEENPAAPYAGPIVGCAYSCPLVLTSVQGDVLVDVDLARTTCTEGLVSSCVSSFEDAGTL